ncbi:MAG: Glyoxalase/bleomycin resistance protein/dioxygenase [Caulobacteraceae bacterium]|nr:Glyoxalase/bleomycin resistance protein/dioxygenase [Caulobacteraceae bacterium]
MSNPDGAFVWYELMTTDAPAAEAFYRGVVGWGSRDASPPGMAYTALLAGDSAVAGLLTLPPPALAGGARPVWIGYVAVDDVDAYADRFAKAGGAVHRAPADIPGVGRFAMVADPQGAPLALFKPFEGMEAQPPVVDRPGAVAWRELIAADAQAAFDFYAGLFGWTKSRVFDMGAFGAYQLFAYGGGGEDVGGMMNKPPSVPVPFWTFYFQVDGIGAAIERLQAGGGTLINGPHQVPTGSWIAQGLDPQGALFSLVSPQA